MTYWRNFAARARLCAIMAGILTLSAPALAIDMASPDKYAEISFTQNSMTLDIAWTDSTTPIIGSPKEIEENSAEFDIHFFPKSFAMPNWDLGYGAGYDYMAMPSQLKNVGCNLPADAWYLDVFNYKVPLPADHAQVFFNTVWQNCNAIMNFTPNEVDAFLKAAASVDSLGSLVWSLPQWILDKFFIPAAADLYFKHVDEDSEGNFSLGVLHLAEINKLRHIRITLPLATPAPDCAAAYALVKWRAP